MSLIHKDEIIPFKGFDRHAYARTFLLFNQLGDFDDAHCIFLHRLKAAKALVWVQYKGYRCLAYLEATGKWINFYTGKKLTDFVKVID